MPDRVFGNAEAASGLLLHVNGVLPYDKHPVLRHHGPQEGAQWGQLAISGNASVDVSTLHQK